MGKINGEELPGRGDFLMGRETPQDRLTHLTNRNPKIPPCQGNEGQLLCNALFIKVPDLSINTYNLVKMNKT